MRDGLGEQRGVAPPGGERRKAEQRRRAARDPRLRAVWCVAVRLLVAGHSAGSWPDQTQAMHRRVVVRIKRKRAEVEKKVLQRGGAGPLRPRRRRRRRRPPRPAAQLVRGQGRGVSHLYGARDAACPICTGRGTRRVLLAREHEAHDLRGEPERGGGSREPREALKAVVQPAGDAVRERAARRVPERRK